jgi:hypothetical protein
MGKIEIPSVGFQAIIPGLNIDYRCEDGKSGKSRGDISAIRKELTPSSENLIITLLKRTVQPGYAFEDTAFKPGFEIVEIINLVVESRLFISLCDKFHQWLSEINSFR